jgi:hypothetical protein
VDDQFGTHSISAARAQSINVIGPIAGRNDHQAFPGGDGRLCLVDRAAWRGAASATA